MIVTKKDVAKVYLERVQDPLIEKEFLSLLKEKHPDETMPTGCTEGADHLIFQLDNSEENVIKKLLICIEAIYYD